MWLTYSRYEAASVTSQDRSRSNRIKYLRFRRVCREQDKNNGRGTQWLIISVISATFDAIVSRMNTGQYFLDDDDDYDASGRNKTVDTFGLLKVALHFIGLVAIVTFTTNNP